MPELPEITLLARQMKDELVGKTIVGVTVLQPKILNVPQDSFCEALNGARLIDVRHHGKWITVETTQGWLMLSLGMGGEILLFADDRQFPEKRQLVLTFRDGTHIVVSFWWFGYAHYAEHPEDHAMTAKLGPNALDLTLDEFRALLRGRRGGIKSFLLNQGHIAGIGNVYVQDPLFRARIHPLRKIDTLTDDEIAALWRALQDTLQGSIDLGGSAWEMDLYGKKGGWSEEQMVVAYQESKPCPRCGTAVEKIRTGSTSTFVCPQCQRLEP
jgi:formamidopyrimidine-DNA glycosylase